MRKGMNVYYTMIFDDAVLRCYSYVVGIVEYWIIGQLLEEQLASDQRQSRGEDESDT